MRNLLVLFTMLLFASLVSAAPPQASQPEFGYDIRSGVADSLKQGEDFDFHAHVFNSSNGVPITSDTSCYLHIYTLDGHHQYEGMDEVASHDFDYGWDVAGANLTNLGHHEYIVQCNNSVAGGFYSGGFIITESGRVEENGAVLVFLMIYALACMFFLLWSLLKILKDLSTLEVDMRTVSLGIAAYFANLALYYYLTIFMPINLMIDLSYIGMSAFGLTHLFVPLVGLIFTWIKKGGVE